MLPPSSTAVLIRFRPGSQPDAIDAVRAGVVRGRVLASNGQPLPDVIVAVQGHPELGQTLTRLDGMFDLAVNGGGRLTINYTHAGYLPAQRPVNVPWQNFAMADDVVLIRPDSRVTTIVAGAATPQLARGNPVTDASGTRQAAVMFPTGTQATMVMPDGTMQALATLNVRATEYTVGPDGPKRMPAPLPPTSGYTYAVDLTVDEALATAATDVIFNQPVPFYVENFLNFPVGIQVPSAYYDRGKAAWVPIPDGKVIKILRITDGLADVDTVGGGTADNGGAIGMTDSERHTLAQSYSAGQSLWRVAITHFTPYDHNYGVVAPSDAQAPQNAQPKPLGSQPEKQQPAEGNSVCGNSIIDCQNQRVRESVFMVGTPFSLHYASNRSAGYTAGRTVQIPLSGPTVPPSLKRIELEISIAGRLFRAQYAAAPNLVHTFVWDGEDAYGREISGGLNATARIDYVYDGFYALPPVVAASFGAAPGVRVPGDIPARDGARLAQLQTFYLGVAPASAVGGWSPTVHHTYDVTSRTLYLGDGRQRSSNSIVPVIATVAGSSTGFGGDGGPATAASLRAPGAVAAGADGSLYIADTDNHRIRWVDPNGIITTVAGTGSSGYSGDGGPATAARLSYPSGVALGVDGSLYIADLFNHRVRRLGPDGIITTVAGMGGSGGFSGDGGPATAAGLNYPSGVALGADGGLYIADSGNNRIRRVGPDGIISTVAGSAGYGGDGGPATAAYLSKPLGVAVGADGLYIADRDNRRIRRVGPDGIITTVAGSGFGGDGVLATAARLDEPAGVALGADGSLYIADRTESRIRRVGPDGIITTVAGITTNGFSGDGGPATAARLNFYSFTPRLTYPIGVALGPNGDLYIADAINDRIRRVGSPLSGFSAAAIAIASENGAEIYQFDVAGRHLRTVNSLTGATEYSFSYDPAGRLATISDGDGNTTIVERDGSGTPTAIVAPDGQRTALTVNADGYLASLTNPAGEQMVVSYAGGGLLTSFTNARGKTSQYTYDPLGQFRTATSPDQGGQTLALADIANGYEVTRSTALGRSTKYRVENLSGGGQKRTTIFPDGAQTVVETAADGTTNTTLSDGSVIQRLDGGDPRFGMQAPLPLSIKTITGSQTSTLTTTRTVKLATPTDPLSIISLTDKAVLNGRTATSVYTAASRTLVTTSRASRKVTMITDAQSRPTTIQVPGIADVTMAYDGRGRLQTVTQGSGPDARTTSYTYGTNGYLQSITDPIGRTVSFEYDAADRVMQQTLPGSRQVGFGYDANGNLTSVTPPGKPAHAFTYTDADLPEEYVPPAVPGGGATTYAYNADRQPDLITRPDGSTLSYLYDGTGKRKKLTISRGDYEYDYSTTTGQLISVSDPQGGTLTYQYTGSLLTGVTRTGTGAGSLTFAYDNDFRIQSVSASGSSTIAYGYDADSLPISVGNFTLTYSNMNALLTGTRLGTIEDSYSYNALGEVAAYTASISGSPAYSVTYGHDKLGRITEKQETLLGVSTTIDYAYDDAGRLHEVRENGAVARTYTYDANGNRLTRTGPGIDETGTYDDQDRMLSFGETIYAYTASGDLQTKTVADQTTTYDYDELGNLVSVNLADGTRIDYDIDGLNRRVGKRVNGTLVQAFRYQDQIKPAVELDGSGNVAARFVYGSRINVPEYIIKGAVTYRVITDQLGSPRLVLNTSSGAVAQRIDYDEFGTVVTDTSPGFQPFGFAGGVYDRDTRLVRFGSRDYDANPGRWLAKDRIPLSTTRNGSIGLGGGNTNLYVYAGSDPINLTDPLGTKPLGRDHSIVGRFTEGSATIRRSLDNACEVFQARIGEPILSGDVVETGPREAALITFANDYSVIVSEGTSVPIDALVKKNLDEEGRRSSFFGVLRGIFVYTSGLIEQSSPHHDDDFGMGGIRG